MKSMTVIFVVFLMAGCATPEQDAERASAICTQSGLKVGTLAFEQCVGRQVAEIQENRDDARGAIAIGLQSYGSSQQQYANSQPTYVSPSPRRISCTSTQTYGTTYTNCY